MSAVGISDSSPADSSRSPASLLAVVNRRTAIPIAIAIWALTGVGDYLTTAEVGFTLFYLVPIGIAVWWRGLRAGLLICLLATASFFGMWIHEDHVAASTVSYLLVLGWNLIGEIGIFLAFAVTLHRLRERLDIEVSERESAVSQLRHADRLNTVGKLAAGVAHELGTPLNVVSGRASLIASGRTTGDDACRSAAIIVEQTERMTVIIKNLLIFARSGGERKPSIDVTRLVHETVSLLEPLARKQGVELVVTSGAPRIAPANAGELQQVMTNLIMNAVHAMPNGGAVRVTLEEGPVKHGAKHGRAAASYVQIRVADQGTGIAPEVLPHIFDPFFTTKDVGVGTGLGLSVTFGIVRDHGGWIQVSTEIGKGTELVVYLPQSHDAPAPTPWLAPASDATAHDPRAPAEARGEARPEDGPGLSRTW